MKRAVVLGASGGMGDALVRELLDRGIETVAFARSDSKLTRLFGKKPGVKIVSGDAYSAQDVEEAAREADVIFHTVSVPYTEWTKGHPRIMRNAVQAAQKNGAKLVLIDNIYAYGRSRGGLTTEEAEQRPHTKKGGIRLQIQRMAEEAHASGTPVMVLHFPDFYGPNAYNTILAHTLQAVLAEKRAMFVGNKNVPREYIYTPDGAKAAVELALRDDAYGERWNIPGAGVISGNELIEMIREQTGYTRSIGTVTTGMIRFLGLFNRDMREIAEMMYLTEEPVVLSGAKYEARIGPLPRTPYAEGVRHTLQEMRVGMMKDD